VLRFLSEALDVRVRVTVTELHREPTLGDALGGGLE
jgi:hypothetical protein